ncbi:GDSL-type esterase/lipase family protein [Halobacillus sp. A5]|uniref:GDSL-type esterase/lipase family protein n=1 Tax=Halobacillus sp. A5 TaxID=2880263 RepID=UPI0020A66876|nr:GDSL-type esterase/lipase family protein [Halobacillus sp. A5]MCP3027118.1 GDSL-type esterase/lipase family protein [Halobacillus sp. A5]
MKKVRIFVLVFMLFVSLPLTAYAKCPVKKEVDYVALGDSLAAGVTPYNQIGEGYPDYFVKRLKQSQYTVDYDNFAAPGADSTHLTGVLNNDLAQSNIEESEFITINIGANDLLPLLDLEKQEYPSEREVASVLAQLNQNINHVFTKIDELNPDTDVYMMGYYNPFPYQPEELQPQLDVLLDSLNQVIQSATAAYGHTYVPTEDVIERKYESFLPNPSNIHLSEEGYEAIAREFWKKLDKSKN